jgi:hypothetical protein
MKLKPFSARENKKAYKLTEFTEMNVTVTLLIEADKDYSNHAYFKFGVITPENDFFWFFDGAVTLNDRKKAIEVFYQLQQYCKQNNIGKPFLIKVKKYRNNYNSKKNN